MSTFKGFSTVQMNRPKQSRFDLSHDRRMTIAPGTCTPLLITECIPSDRFNGASEVLLRLMPLLAPIYDRINMYVHYFFVPNRLLWVEWEKFITGGRLGVGIDPLVAPIPPRFEIEDHFDSFADGDLADYLGVPRFENFDPDPADWANKYVDAMPFAAYQCVWFNYYRDRNFVSDDFYGTSENGAFPPLPSGTLTAATYGQMVNLRQRSYAHDYFTSALPFTQRGEEVLMPVQLGGLAPIYANPPGTGATSLTMSGIKQPGSTAVGLSVIVDEVEPGPSGSNLWVDGNDFDGTTTSINDFRAAYALQVWLERNAVGGSRYNESTHAHFGVKPQDSRLQRPEYIGGGRVSVKISEIVSTAWSEDATPATVPQGNLAGHGIAYGNQNKFNYFCAEHGFIIGIATIMPVASYQQGLPRMFRRRSFLDYPWPTFAKLGEQPVYDHEIYADPASLTEDADGEYPEFGFQSRYADWKWLPSTNHGYFREGLLFWTLTRTFATPPVLSEAFTQVSSSAMDRIFAAGFIGENGFILYVHNRISVVRALPYFGTPNTMGFS